MAWRASTPEDHDRIATLMLALYAEDPAPIAPTREGGLATLAELAQQPLRGVAVVHEPAGGRSPEASDTTARGLDGYALLCSCCAASCPGSSAP